MKYLLLLSLLSVPALAQAPKNVTETPTDEAISNKQEEKSKLPQTAEEEKQKEEEANLLGPYDREGNYKVRIKPKDEQISE